MPQGRRVGPQPRPHALRAALKAIVPLSRRACATQAVSGLRMRARLRIAVCLATSSVWVASETLSKCCKHVSTAIMARPNTKKRRCPHPNGRDGRIRGCGAGRLACATSCSSARAGCHCPHFSQALKVALKVMTSQFFYPAFYPRPPSAQASDVESAHLTQRVHEAASRVFHSSPHSYQIGCKDQLAKTVEWKPQTS